MRRTFFVLALLAILLLSASVQAGDRETKKQACIASLSGYPTELAGIAAPPIPTDLRDAELVYFESGCYGNCPSFKLTLRKEEVRFEGHAYVRAKGRRRAKMKPGEFERFVRSWFDGRLYAMRNDYCSATCPDGSILIVTDVQESAIELSMLSYKKRVFECYFTISGQPGMPKPPQQYSDLRKLLFQFAKEKGWV